MSSFRVAVDVALFTKTTTDVCVPEKLEDLLFRALRLSHEFAYIVDLYEGVSIECPCTKFVSFQEADFLSKKERLLAVPVRRQNNLAVGIQSWTPDNLLIKILADLNEEGKQSPICHIQFDKDVDSFTVDRLDGKESQIVIFSDYEDIDGTTELRLSLISTLSSVVRNAPQLDQHPFVCLGASTQCAKLAKSTNNSGRNSYILPVWYAQLMSLWLSNIVRAHVLCNAALPAGFERPFVIDNILFIQPGRDVDCTLYIYLHKSTTACICNGNAPHGASQPMFRLSFCGTCFNGCCYRHGTRSTRECVSSVSNASNKHICMCNLQIRAICKHDGDTEAYKRSRLLLTKPDSFLSTACAVACELAVETCDTTDKLKSLLLDAYKNVLHSESRLITDEAQLTQNDMIVECMIKSTLFTKRRKRGSSELQVVRKDGGTVRSHERAALLTHSHLLG